MKNDARPPSPAAKQESDSKNEKRFCIIAREFKLNCFLRQSPESRIEVKVENLYFTKLPILSQVFSPSAPVEDKDIFAGRVNQLRACFEAVHQRGCHVALYGDRGVGKTSFSNILRVLLTGTVAVKVNCETNDTLDSVWKKVFDRVLYEYKNEKSELGLQGGVKVTAGKVPVSDLVSNAEKPFAATMVDQCLDFAPKPLIIIFDEFDRLGEQFDRRAFTDQLKNISDNRPSVTVVLVGVAEDISELVGDHASIERCLKQLHLPIMAEAELRAVCQTGMSKLGMTMEAGVEDQIVMFSCGYPHFTHLLALNASKMALQEGELKITARHLDLAVEQSINETQETLRTAYQNATLATRENLFDSVLWACADAALDENGTFQASDVIDPLSRILGKEATVQTFIYHLGKFSSDERGNILIRVGQLNRQRYKFRMPLMRAFVRLKHYKELKKPH